MFFFFFLFLLVLYVLPVVLVVLLGLQFLFFSTSHSLINCLSFIYCDVNCFNAQLEENLECFYIMYLTLKGIRGVNLTPRPSIFFGFKILFFDR